MYRTTSTQQWADQPSYFVPVQNVYVPPYGAHFRFNAFPKVEYSLPDRHDRQALEDSLAEIEREYENERFEILRKEREQREYERRQQACELRLTELRREIAGGSSKQKSGASNSSLSSGARARLEEQRRRREVENLQRDQELQRQIEEENERRCLRQIESDKRIAEMQRKRERLRAEAALKEAEAECEALDESERLRIDEELGLDVQNKVSTNDDFEKRTEEPTTAPSIARPRPRPRIRQRHRIRRVKRTARLSRSTIQNFAPKNNLSSTPPRSSERWKATTTSTTRRPRLRFSPAMRRFQSSARRPRPPPMPPPFRSDISLFG